MANLAEENALKQRNEIDGSRLKLRSIAIHKFLLDKTTGSERSIRQACGDTPDTSKALRLLVKENRVKRFGSGGRVDPYVYMALVLLPLCDLQLLKEAQASESSDSLVEA